MINKVAVIGSGTMGNGIAHVFALKGNEVTLIDVSQEALDKALKTIETNLDRQVKKEQISDQDKTNTLNRINTASSLDDGINDQQLVVEAISEDFELKKKIFSELDKLCASDTILASNTSSISITALAACTKRPEKVIGMHFMNPVPVMQLVEIISGRETAEATLETVISTTKSLNKIPVASNDFPGFIANRILMPMINEAIFALHEGVAKVDAIDEVMKLGMSHPMGPLQLADFIGLDVCLSIMEVLHNGFKNEKYAPCPLLINMVNSGNLGVKSGVGFYDYSNGIKNAVVANQFNA